MELQVRVDNARAIHLYETSGFAREGIRRHGFKIEGAYFDLYYMSKLIGG